ncbi:MAG TPA: hypothetical protein VK898_13050 [Chloroflexota bacterium]|nr:hypothetical protein [Chloroflexota bacterium]
MCWSKVLLLFDPDMDPANVAPLIVFLVSPRGLRINGQATSIG